MIWIGLLLIIFLVGGIPIGVAFIVATFLGYWLLTSNPLSLVAYGLFTRLDSFLLLAVPFYIFTGTMMGKGKSAKKLMDFIEIFFGRIPGGLLISVVAACAFFGAISGSSVAGVVAIGTVMFPILKEKGFDKYFSLGVITSSGTLGVIIPPSIPMVIYAMMANVSIAGLFLTGFLPGLLLATLFSIYILGYSKKNHFPTSSYAKFTIKRMTYQFYDSLLALITPVIILGGIYSGVFTPTESAVIASVYILAIEILVYRTVTWRSIKEALMETGTTTGIVLIILVGASIFSDFLMIERIPFKMAELGVAYLKNKFIFLLVINIVLLIMGCFIDMLSIIMIVTPLFLPMAMKFGIDPIHFGIIAVVNTSAGLLTPPFGLNAYVASGVFREPLEKVFKSVIPYVFIYLIVIALITYWADFVLVIPRFFGYVK